MNPLFKRISLAVIAFLFATFTIAGASAYHYAYTAPVDGYNYYYGVPVYSGAYYGTYNYGYSGWGYNRVYYRYHYPYSYYGYTNSPYYGPWASHYAYRIYPASVAYPFPGYYW